ncbi:N-acetylneuraminate synthase family protein [Balneola vulgaris]|uniref:N-acetylneuraminate synthase family protein n=1 Tax=Balneola vulgaris TaxID=287535 RepID=UPI00037EBA94|nr:N-acetylneuraminate synthase family protein [Balneola vulgaris]
MKAPKVIAEIGCNHKGQMEIAEEMIMMIAKFCKADYAKFQKRNPKEVLTPEQYNMPHPVEANSYGTTYGEHREFLEFDLDQHKQLKAWCEEQGIGYSTSVWDLTSAEEITSLNPDFIKIPSGTNQHYEVLNYLCEQFAGDIHVSVGMTTHEEERKLIDFFKERGRNKSLVLYSCTSGYPVPFEDIGLYEITRLIENYGEEVKQIGFSGHHLGIAADIAAMTLGAEWVERHFTLDRTWKGTDHAASLEPEGMRKLVRDLRNVSKALNYKESEILEIEKPQRDKLKWGI